MKRIILCLLSIGLIVGCSSQKDNVSVKNKNTQNPSAPYLSQIVHASERKEIVQNIYDEFDQTSIDNENIQNEHDKADQTTQTDTINKSMDNEPNEIIYTDRKDTYLLVLEEHGFEDDYVDENAIINQSTNAYYNWLTNYDLGEDKNELLYLDLEGQLADELNQEFDEIYYKGKETGGFAVMWIAGWEEIYQDILSITVRTRSFAGEFYKLQNVKVYNIDLTTHQLFSNQELLGLYGLDYETAQQVIDEQLEKDQITVCSETDFSNCYYIEYESGMNPLLVSRISDTSFLFIDEQGNLNMLMSISYPKIAMYDGEVNHYYVITLTGK